MQAVWNWIKGIFGFKSQNENPCCNGVRRDYINTSYVFATSYTNGHSKTEVSEIKSLSIFPRENDLFGGKPELKQNIIKGSYGSVDHYLTVQFKLLHEDFIAPLREGIAEYLSCPTDSCSKRYSDVIVFRNVKILHSLIESGQMGHGLQLDNKTDWEEVSQSFIFGSLLLFTTNDFQSFFTATVIQAESKSQIIVKLHKSHNTVCDNIYCENFVMATSKVFFEPYFHVLTALQNMTWMDFPMAKYIVEVNPQTKLPAYVNYYNRTMYTVCNERVNILDHSWSQFTSVKFNPSQHRALNAALTNDFVVIQGPPGTGKTFLGYQIVTALLDNAINCTPILVVCLKNHALDQFLEGLLKKTKKIIRIGGRSNNEKLEDFNLKKHRKKYGYWKFNERLRDLAEEYSYKEKKLNELNTHHGGAWLAKGIKNEMIQLEESIRKVENKLKEARNSADLSVLKSADVIGMTTTGAARLRPMLNRLGAKIVVIEEAAEVLESHIVTALSNKCQHVILIGDHKQLRPNPAVYELCKNYNFDISLFERMVNNGLSCYTLDVQHRMRPEFASLISPAVYPTLTDHQTTKGRPNILGVHHNLYFLNHNRYEKQLKDSVSHVNQFEADIVVELSRYLVMQGYSTEQITILTTYSDQVKRIIQLKKRYFHQLSDLKVTTVDDFQGEENKIIILSLVRSNKEKKIGFLKEENRVCVALSRARDGLYIFGNMDLLSQKSNIWRKVKQRLLQHNALGSSLSVYCQIHPEMVMQARNGAMFRDLPEGGCRRICQAKLRCGHVCQYHCHPCDRSHEKQYKECKLKCGKKCKRNHPCPLFCMEPCKTCQVSMRFQLSCGRTVTAVCSSYPALTELNAELTDDD